MRIWWKRALVQGGEKSWRNRESCKPPSLGARNRTFVFRSRSKPPLTTKPSLQLLHLFTYLGGVWGCVSVPVCMHTCTHDTYMCRGAFVEVRRQRVGGVSSLFFDHVSPRDGTQVTRLGRECLDPISPAPAVHSGFLLFMTKGTQSPGKRHGPEVLGPQRAST